ncbi:sugar transferase [Butyrivibrio sp. CB08]|uniref:sugar transferase n=1 Tax=Butyrivibrio sp. CB08 TaxID=2364879 RepID=UPI000EAA9E8F|nr:sugar transferase [Butyrivibrio sp. CB08]RKM57900.1 sugar transferase [Butyrivibrio sp. CB08]
MTRVFDIVFSFVAIVILTPFMIPIMIALKLTGEHDIFYKQMRVGKYGKEFGLLKFATMLRNSPNLPGGLFTSENDPRMLPMGPFLRKTKINELPQLINILKGDMSIIGYRPQVRKQYEFFPVEDQKLMATDIPGLSGLGAVVFRDEEEMLRGIDDHEKFYEEIISPYKSKLECYYIQHKTVGLYFKMIWLTVKAVLKPGDNSWKKLKDLPEIPDELKPYI